VKGKNGLRATHERQLRKEEKREAKPTRTAPDHEKVDEEMYQMVVEFFAHREGITPGAFIDRTLDALLENDKGFEEYVSAHS
jgi:hypothetical protein